MALAEASFNTDVGGIDETQGYTRHAVNQNQRFAAVDGRHAADIYVVRSGRVTRIHRDVERRVGTLQRLNCRNDRMRGEVVAGDGGDGTRNVHSTLFGITYYHDVVD